MIMDIYLYSRRRVRMIQQKKRRLINCVILAFFVLLEFVWSVVVSVVVSGGGGVGHGRMFMVLPPTGNFTHLFGAKRQKSGQR